MRNGLQTHSCRELQLPKIKIHCSVMAEEAIENYKEKNK